MKTEYAEEKMAHFILARCAEYKKNTSHMSADFAYLTAIEAVVKTGYFLDDPEYVTGCTTAYSEGQPCDTYQKTLRVLAAIWKQHPEYDKSWSLKKFKS
jgi:hypothetical protein